MRNFTRNKQVAVWGLVALALGASIFGGVVGPSQGSAGVGIAHASECGGVNPPPNLDCPQPTPTPTPTPSPGG